MQRSGALAASLASLKIFSTCQMAWVTAVSLLLSAALAVISWLVCKRSPVWLLNFYCFHPPEHLAAGCEQFVDGIRRSGRWSKESTEFMSKVVRTSGLGDRTYFPAEIAALQSGSELKTTFKGAQAETEMVLFSSIAKVLDSLSLAPQQVWLLTFPA